MQVKKSNDSSANGFPTEDGLLDMKPGLTGWVDYGNEKYPRELSEGKFDDTKVDTRGRHLK